MILSKAPLRVSFFGGGSDIPAHFLNHGGATLSTAIDKYVYVSVIGTPQPHIKLTYSKLEVVSSVDDIQNEIVRNALKYFGIKSNIEITSFADIPTIGSGLGGSSAFTCALVAALSRYLEYDVDAYKIAQIACHIEINMCGWRIGYQDQYASAFGGFNYIEYKNLGSASVTKVQKLCELDSLYLIPTKIERHSTKVLNSINFDEKTALICELAEYAKRNKDKFLTPKQLGSELKKCWEIKKMLDGGVSNDKIDKLYTDALEKGAIGGKLLGAGGGGYLMVVADHPAARKHFRQTGAMKINIAEEGAKVVYED